MLSIGQRFFCLQYGWKVHILLGCRHHIKKMKLRAEPWSLSLMRSRLKNEIKFLLPTEPSDGDARYRSGSLGEWHGLAFTSRMTVDSCGIAWDVNISRACPITNGKSRLYNFPKLRSASVRETSIIQMIGAIPFQKSFGSDFALWKQQIDCFHSSAEEVIPICLGIVWIGSSSLQFQGFGFSYSR